MRIETLDAIPLIMLSVVRELGKRRFEIVAGARRFRAAKLAELPAVPARMHVLIAGPGCDHRNRNGLDNRRDNLRPATGSQQKQNRRRQRNNKSGYIGVYWNKVQQLWHAQIMHNQKSVWIGRYNSAIEAARARDAKAIEIFGPFAVLNFPKLESAVGIEPTTKDFRSPCSATELRGPETGAGVAFKPAQN